MTYATHIDAECQALLSRIESERVTRAKITRYSRLCRYACIAYHGPSYGLKIHTGGHK